MRRLSLVVLLTCLGCGERAMPQPHPERAEAHEPAAPAVDNTVDEESQYVESRDPAPEIVPSPIWGKLILRDAPILLDGEGVVGVRDEGMFVDVELERYVDGVVIVENGGGALSNYCESAPCSGSTAHIWADNPDHIIQFTVVGRQ